MNCFNRIDIEKWDRKECYMHFMTRAKSTYSITVNMDISELVRYLKEQGLRLYPTFTWMVARAINNHMEFKMGFDQGGQLGYFDNIHPDYAVLNERTKIMDSLCTEFKDDFEEFYNQMLIDMDHYRTEGIHTKPCDNFFVASCLPWIHYESFTASNESGQSFIFPMVTWGKYVEHDAKVLMPVTLQIHHAVADGYHCSLFYRDLEEMIAHPNEFLSRE